MPAVQLENVSKAFHSVPAVRGIDLAVQDGEFLALLGPSGCGKTTTLRMVAGFEVPTAGEIRIRDRIVSGPGHFVPPEARNVGMVFQSYAVWPHMTVEGNVSYPLKLRGLSPADRRERTRQVLELVQLPGLEGRFPHQPSGGEEQRVALARALNMEPAVLLLDERLSNLDAQLRKEMRLEIKALQRRLGIAILYVTHDQEESLTMADRVAVMGRGAFISWEPPRRYTKSWPMGSWRSLWAGRLFLPARQPGRTGSVSSWERRPPARRVPWRPDSRDGVPGHPSPGGSPDL